MHRDHSSTHQKLQTVIYPQCMYAKIKSEIGKFLMWNLTTDFKCDWPLICIIVQIGAIIDSKVIYLDPEGLRIVLKITMFVSLVLGCALCGRQISISIKILGYEDIEENSGCRYQMEQSWAAKTTLKPSTQDMRKARERGNKSLGSSKGLFKPTIFLRISVFRMRLCN